MKPEFIKTHFYNKTSHYFFAVIFSFISFSSSAQNVLKNPGFESEGKDWIIWNTGEWQSDVVKSGKYSLKVSQKTARYSGANQTIIFPNNVKKLEVSGWIKTEGVEQSDSRHKKANFAIAMEDSAGNNVGGEIPSVGSQIGNSDWTFFKRSYKVPEGAKQVRLVAFLSNCAGTAWFDDLEIKLYDKKGRMIIVNSNLISKVQPINRIYPQWKLKEDYNQLVKSLRNHPAPFEFISKSEFETLVDSQYNKITDSMKLYEFYSICSPVVASIGCCHTTLQAICNDVLPSPVFSSQYIYFDNDRMFVIKQPDFFPELTVGSEITKINNKPVSEIYSTIFNNISSDGYNKQGRQFFINAYFNMYYIIFYGYTDTHSIAYKQPGDDKERVRNSTSVFLKPNESELPMDSSSQDPALGFKILEKENTAVIMMKSFVYYNKQEYEYFRKFIDNCFAEINDKKVSNLIIDLRGNGGGNLYCSAYFLNYIINKPIIYFRKGTPHYENLTYHLFPAAKHYTGVPYILTNNGGFSTNGHLTALLKHHKLGVLIGEETAATYTCNAAVREIELIHTNIILSRAQTTYTAATEDFPKDRGIMPDVEVKPSLENIIDLKDVVMERALKMIREKKE